MPSRAKTTEIRLLLASLEQCGLVHLPGCSDASLVEVLEALGTPIHVEEVRVTPGAKSLVKSTRGISWHTDHHRAEFICWFGRTPADEGGETLVVDGRAALAELPRELQSRLLEVRLLEHSVFEGDERTHPMVTDSDGVPRIYYSLWLAEDSMDQAQREAFEAFGDSVERMPCSGFRLERGDILVIDNRRMLHARTQIGGRATRHLRRYWIASR